MPLMHRAMYPTALDSQCAQPRVPLECETGCIISPYNSECAPPSAWLARAERRQHLILLQFPRLVTHPIPRHPCRQCISMICTPSTLPPSGGPGLIPRTTPKARLRDTTAASLRPVAGSTCMLAGDIPVIQRQLGLREAGAVTR